MSTPEKKPNQMHAHHGASNEKPARTSVPTRRRSQVAEVEIGAAEEGGHFVGMQTREYSGWDVYNNEAKKVDTELVNDWRDSLNSLLLFAAIFAAVLTAFIIESKKMLEQDPTSILVDVMISYTNNLANGTYTPYTVSEFQPSSSAVTVNCLFFASLSTSLVAALASVVALQWVADYDAAITRGGSSPEDRAKRRQFRYAGVIWWKMGEVIAALPLLIYSSVALFFLGLIEWMLAIQQIVGLIIVGGAGLAVLFYGISTVLTVAFVSAPFRTPLGRWIYSSILLFSSMGYHIVRFLKISFIPAWLKETHLTHALSRRREDLEVDKRPGLGMEALVWLASQLSISQDSYDRLLLLAGELPKLKWAISSFTGFSDAPWFLIFDLLGWKNLKSDQNDVISPQEIKTFAILAQCYRIPEIHEIISPSRLTPYVADASDDTYWSQYCRRAEMKWSSHISPSTPNSMFLLLRDIPLPSNDSPDALELTIHLSRWRNSPASIPQVKDGMPDLGIAPSNTTLNDSIVKVGRSDNAEDLPLWFLKDDKRLYVIILGRMIPMLIRDEGKIPPSFLDALRWRFEVLLLGVDTADKVKCLSKPLHYRDALLQGSAGLKSLHYAFMLLLARNLNSFTGAERALRLKELLTMLWASPVFRRLDRAAVHHRLGMEDFFEANKILLMGWIEDSELMPYIHDILHSLAIAQAEEPEIGPLWRCIPPQEGDDPHLTQALTCFNNLIGWGRAVMTPARHYVMIDLVCRDLAFGPSEAFKDYFTPHRLQDIDYLLDPCLRLLGQSFAGSGRDFFYLSPEDAAGPLMDSWTRVATYFMTHPEGTSSALLLRIQGSLWPAISNRNDLCSRALMDPKTFSHLHHMFEYPIACQEHNHSEGHLLLHILNGFPNCIVEADLSAYTAIPMQDRRLKLELILLILPGDQYKVRPELLRSNMNMQCFAQILKIGKAVRSSQFSMLSLLSDLPTHIINDEHRVRNLWPDELAALSVGALRALELPRDPRAALVIPKLVAGMVEAKRVMYERGHQPEWENMTADREATTTVSRLVSHLASMTVFGGQSRRILSCAQPRGAYSPAVGWMSPHID